MQVERLSHSLLKKSLLSIHKNRLSSLLASANSIVKGAQLSVTQIGRLMNGTAKVKNKIKRVDRLLNNQNLYQDKDSIFTSLNHLFFSGTNRLIVVVDWSPYKHKRDFGVLRATVILKNSAIPVYQEVRRYNQLRCLRFQKTYLKKLKKSLPKSCQVVVVTDMGFLSDWFKMIAEIGWDYLGRIRSDCKYSIDGKTWGYPKLNFPIHKPIYYQNVHIFRKNSISAHLVMYKVASKNSKKSKNPTIAQYQKIARLPWYLVTSLEMSAKSICNLYKKRMRIEATFRDNKSYRFGMGLNTTRQVSNSLTRRENLLLIAYVAYCLLLLIGWLAEKNKWHWDFQANSIKNRRVLSLVSLGRNIIKHALDRIILKEFQLIPKELAYEANLVFEEV